MGLLIVSQLANKSSGTWVWESLVERQGIETKMRLIGVLLIAFGVVDFGGGLADRDLWGCMGVDLPHWLRQYTAYIEMALGVTLHCMAEYTESKEEELQ